MLAVVVVGAISIRGGVDLRARRTETARVFDEGANGDGLGIRYDLDTQVAVTHNLMTVAKRYLPENDDGILAVDEARERLLMAKDMRGMYEDSVSLLQCADALLSRLSDVEVSEQDARYLRGFTTDLHSTEVTMAADVYNEAAAVYNKLLEGFPGRMIAFVNQIEPAAFFGLAESSYERK